MKKNNITLIGDLFSTKNLLGGSMIMFFGTTLMNAGNYFFHLMTGRMLGPEKYGELQSIISSLYLLGILPLSLNLVIMKFVAGYKKEPEKIAEFFYWLRVRILVIGFFIVLFLIIILPFWSSFLHLDDHWSLLFSFLSVPLTLLLVTSRSFLQGILNFFGYSLSNVSEVAFKIFLSFILILLGWSVNGVVLAMLFAGIISFLITQTLLGFKKVVTGKISFTHHRELLFYSVPVLISTLTFTSLYTSDILLVKHFFSTFESGIYASLSVLGKIIFFASAPLIGVMFPLISTRHQSGQAYQKVLWLTLLLVFLLCLALLTLYFFLPNLMISLLFGKKFLAGQELVAYFAVFLSCYSLANTLNSFYLSIGKTRVVIFSMVASLVQIVLIVFWHTDLKMIILDNIIATFLLLISLLLYYPYAKNSR